MNGRNIGDKDMKKTLAIITLLISTTLSAHGPSQSNLFNHPMFNDGFWRDFDCQFQQFDHQINRLQRNARALSTHSKQYFDKDTNSYIIKIKTSGIDKDNFNISSDKNKLIIKAKQSSSDDNRSSSSSFSQMVSIPRDGDIDNIVAEFKNGVLKVSIPKLEKPRSQIRKITIQ